MKTNREMKDNEQSLTEYKGIGRRDFIKTTGLAVIGLGAGLGAITSFAWDKKTYPYDVLTYPQGIETPKTLFNLTDALLARGYKKEDLAKLWGGNWVRVMKAVVG